MVKEGGIRDAFLRRATMNIMTVFEATLPFFIKYTCLLHEEQMTKDQVNMEDA